MGRLSYVALISLLACPGMLYASDWQHVSQSSSTFSYMDFDSISSVGSYRKAWVRVVYGTPQSTADYPPKQYRSQKWLYYFDCPSQQMAVTQMVKYENLDSSGEVVSSHSIKFNKNMLDEIVPDTVGETLLRVACDTSANRAKIKARNRSRSEASRRALMEEKTPEHATEAAARRAGDE